MEHHADNHDNPVIAIVPARYKSTRLVGKLLLEIDGKPLILHTVARAHAARTVDRVIVATDDQRISDVVRRAGFEAVMTMAGHQSGSDRIAEVARTLPVGAVIVNVQGDEPMIPPSTIDRAVTALLADDDCLMSTTCEPIADARDVLSPDVVKVVMDLDGNALYFSRSPIPFPRDAVKRHGSLGAALTAEPELVGGFRKHTGLYVYRREFLLDFTELPIASIESVEVLEQMRALENGAKIRVVEVSESSIGVDTEEDLRRVRDLMTKKESL